MDEEENYSNFSILTKIPLVKVEVKLSSYAISILPIVTGSNLLGFVYIVLDIK